MRQFILYLIGLPLIIVSILCDLVKDIIAIFVIIIGLFDLMIKKLKHESTSKVFDLKKDGDVFYILTKHTVDYLTIKKQKKTTSSEQGDYLI